MNFKILVIKALYQLLGAVILKTCHSGETSKLRDEMCEYWIELEEFISTE